MNDTTIGQTAAATPAPAPAPPRFDFPGWMPPMLVKELRQGLRQRGFVGGLIAAQAVLVIMFITGFVNDVGNGSSSRQMIDGIFWSTLFATLLLMAPLRALGALSAEMEARTMDLLLLTRLDAWRIVWGKWVSLMAQSLLLVTALLPYAVVRYFFGSVDLVQDLVLILLMLGGGAVSTAAGLWASGMNRVIRLLVVIGAILASFGAFGTLMNRHGIYGAFGGMGGSGPVPTWLIFGFFAWVGASLLAYFLMMAVRWFAPMSENHAIGPRLMPFVLAVPLAVFAAYLGHRDLRELTGVWLAACGVIAAIEMASTREVMAIHLRGRLGRSGFRRLVGAGLLPGWPSAAFWIAGMLAAVVAVWGVADLVSADDLGFAAVPWLATLAWSGLVFPALLVSLVPSVSRVSGVLYFMMHALLGVFAVMAGSSSLSRSAPKLMQTLDWISHAVPTTSFWHALNELKQPSELPALEFGQALGVALTLALMLLMAKPYWLNVRLMREAAARSAGRE